MVKTTEHHMLDAIKHVQVSCVGNQIFHLSQRFKDSPGQYAVVTCYVTLPDELADGLKDSLDEAVRHYLAEAGYELGDSPPQ